MKQLSGQDASFLYVETATSPMHITSLSIYDPVTAPGGMVGIDQLTAHVGRRLHLAPLFRQKVARIPLDLDHPYWVDDPEFDLEFHIRHIALPAPGDWTQLCVQAARLHARPLDHSRPLWELYLIEGLHAVGGVAPGSFAVLQKIHHAAVDGVSGLELTAALHDPEPETPGRDDPVEWAPRVEPSAQQLLARTMVNNAVQPFRFARYMARSMETMRRAAPALARRPGVRPGLPPAPRTRFGGKVSAHRVIEGRRFALGDLKTIRSAVPGATINDVVLAQVGGALRDYLLGHDELPQTSLVAMCPISVRTPGEAGRQGNRVAAMMVPLCTEVADPLERLAAVRLATSQTKEIVEAVDARLLSDGMQFIPGSLTALGTRVASESGLANRLNPMFNTVVTNVPGSPLPLYFCGAQLSALYGLGPVQNGTGLFHAVTSMAGSVCVTATACRDLMGDAARYGDCLQRSFDELAAAAP